MSTDEGGEIYELTSRSPTSKNAFRALLNRYGRHPQRRKGMIPLIKLVDSTYFDEGSAPTSRNPTIASSAG